jgi:hypothetical protein
MIFDVSERVVHFLFLLLHYMAAKNTTNVSEKGLIMQNFFSMHTVKAS